MQNTTRVLVVDNERSVRNSLKERLEYEQYEVDLAESYEEGMAKISLMQYDIVLTGVMLEVSDHMGKLRRLLGKYPFMEIIILARADSITLAVDYIRNGAFDFITKPVDFNRLLGSVRSAASKIAARRSHHIYQEAEDILLDYTGQGKLSDDGRDGQSGSGASPSRGAVACDLDEEKVKESQISAVIDSIPSRKRVPKVEEIIGHSDGIKHVKHLIDKVAPSGARVLIMGANGTGKELVARWLHEKSSRAGNAFVEVNCAAIPSELIESELFGHEKGSFTSAIKQRKGKFEQADGGTLFLDEIGDMSLSAQAKVLRALQENKISRVGSDKDIDVNVRIVAATNKNLRDEIDKCNFREDLYHRLSVIIIRVPALRERKEDIPEMVDAFIKKICTEYSVPVKKIESEAMSMLQNKPWTGNVRELHNVVERLIILSGDVITANDVEVYAEEMI